jgi:hypothetical protein
MRIHAEAALRYDHHHLILGDKHKLHSLKLSMLRKLCARYYDVLLVQAQPSWETTDVLLQELHEQTGLPVLLGDSAFSVRGRGHEQGVKGIRCISPEEAGMAYASYIQTGSEIPHIVGWHLCGYMEGWPGSSIPERALSHIQCGFIDPFEVPYEDYLCYVSQANRVVNRNSFP